MYDRQKNISRAIIFSFPHFLSTFATHRYIFFAALSLRIYFGVFLLTGEFYRSTAGNQSQELCPKIPKMCVAAFREKIVRPFHFRSFLSVLSDTVLASSKLCCSFVRMLKQTCVEFVEMKTLFFPIHSFTIENHVSILCRIPVSRKKSELSDSIPFFSFAFSIKCEGIEERNMRLIQHWN